MKRLGMLTADSVAMLMLSIGYGQEDIINYVAMAKEEGEAYPPGPVNQIVFSKSTDLFVMYVDTKEPIGDDDMPPEVIR